jgi:hypothetical protein
MRPTPALLAALALLTAVRPAAAAPAPPAAPGRLTGRVLDRRGAPVARFTVNDAVFTRGRFDLPLPVGHHRLVFRAAGHAPIVVAVHATARGTPGRRFVLPDLVVGPGATLLGAVVDAVSGRPVASAVAALGGPPDYAEADAARPERLSERGATGAGGAYLLRNAARGQALLVVSHPEYLTAVVPVSTGAPVPTVRLHAGGVLGGVARDARGRPIPSARVLAVSENARDAQESRADAQGVFRMTRLQPGRYTVLASGGLSGTAVSEAAVADGRETRVELTVKAGAAPRVASAR